MDTPKTFEEGVYVIFKLIWEEAEVAAIGVFKGSAPRLTTGLPSTLNRTYDPVPESISSVTTIKSLFAIPCVYPLTLSGSKIPLVQNVFNRSP